MTEYNSVLADPCESAQMETISLADYRTVEMVERLTELVSVPEAFRKMLTATLLMAGLSCGACLLIHAASSITPIPLLCISAYSLVAGAILGLLLGVARIVVASLNNVESILRILLETTGKIATEYERLQAGAIRLPSAGRLVQQVYEGVMMPAVEQAVGKAFGVLATPVLWAYRVTINRAVGHLVSRIDRAQTPDEAARSVSPKLKSGLAEIAKYSAEINAGATLAADAVGRIGRTVQFCVMLPIYVCFGTALAVAAIPVLLARFFVGQ